MFRDKNLHIPVISNKQENVIICVMQVTLNPDTIIQFAGGRSS